MIWCTRVDANCISKEASELARSLARSSRLLAFFADRHKRATRWIIGIKLGNRREMS